MTVPPRLRVVGPGRAGRSLATALGRAGWEVAPILGRGDDVTDSLSGTDLLVIATPDATIADVAAAVAPDPRAVIAHLAGSLGLDVLAGHARVAGIHPLVALPSPELGAERLADDCWFAVAGDPLAQRVVSDLDGHWFAVADDDRAEYHAAAVVASNHLVALMGQVARIAGHVGAPPEAYAALARRALDDAITLGPSAALTGPAARGDWATVARHLEAIDPSERDAYRVLAAAARRLVADDGLPPDLP